MDDQFSDRTLRALALNRADIERLARSSSASHLTDCGLAEADLIGLDLGGLRLFDASRFGSATIPESRRVSYWANSG